MTAVAGMAVTASVPAAAVTPADALSAQSTASALPAQVFTASAYETAAVVRDGYAVQAAPEPVVTVAGVALPAATGLVVWPVGAGSRVSDGFGPRDAPCGGCSSVHDGIDFNPGAGASVGAITDGVVVTATEGGGGLGVYVEVQHSVGGRTITSLYAHMAYGSLGVSVGDTVAAGQYLGAVGSTGQSTGAHLHLELYYEDEVRIDGYAWLSENGAV